MFLSYFDRVLGKLKSVAIKSGIVCKWKRLYYYFCCYLIRVCPLNVKECCLFMTHLLPESFVHYQGEGEKRSLLDLLEKDWLEMAGKCLLFPATQMLTLFYIFCFSVPPPSASNKIFKFVIKATVFGLMGYGCYRIGQRTVQFILSMPAAQNYLQKLTEIRSHH